MLNKENISNFTPKLLFGASAVTGFAGMFARPELLFPAAMLLAVAGGFAKVVSKRTPQSGSSISFTDRYGFSEGFLTEDPKTPQATQLQHEIQVFLHRAQPSLRNRLKGEVHSFCLQFTGERAPAVQVWSPAYLLFVLVSPQLHDRLEAALTQIGGWVQNKLLEELVQKYATQVKTAGAFPSAEAARLEIERCLKVGLVIQILKNPGERQPNRVLLGLRRTATSLEEVARAMVLPKADSKIELFWLDVRSSEEGQRVIRKPVDALLLPSGYTLFAGARPEIFDLGLEDGDLVGRFYVRDDGRIENSLGEFVSDTLGLNVLTLTPPWDLSRSRQSEFKGRIRPHGIVSTKSKDFRRIEDHPFDDLSVESFNIFGRHPVTPVSVADRLNLKSLRALLIDTPFFRDGSYQKDRELVASGTGNFLLSYEKNDQEFRPRWFIEPIQGSEVRLLTGLKAQRVSEWNIEQYDPISGRVLVPASDLFLATRSGQGPWLILYLETGTTVGPVGGEELYVQHLTDFSHVDDQRVLLALEGLLNRFGVADHVVSRVGSGEVAGQGLVRLIEGPDVKLYAKIPDGQEMDRHEAAIRGLAATGTIRLGKASELARQDFDVCSLRVDDGGVPVEQGGVLIVLTPAYLALNHHLASFGEDDLIGACRAFHDLIAAGFSQRLIASDLHLSNLGFRDAPGRGRLFHIFDYGAFGVQSEAGLSRGQVPRHEGSYFAPELDAPGTPEVVQNYEGLQIWFEGLLFYQLLADGKLPSGALLAISTSGQGEFEKSLDRELRVLLQSRPAQADLIDLIWRMTRWEPEGRPSLQGISARMKDLKGGQSA